MADRLLGRPRAAGAADPRQRGRRGQLGCDVHVAGGARPSLRHRRRGARRRDVPRPAAAIRLARATATITGWRGCARRAGARPRSPRCCETQAAAWNRGDLETFCALYAADAVVRLAERPDAAAATRSSRATAPSIPTPRRAARCRSRSRRRGWRPAWRSTPFDAAVPGGVHGASVLARWTLTYAGKPPATGLTLLTSSGRVRCAPRGQPRWEILQDASFEVLSAAVSLRNRALIRF